MPEIIRRNKAMSVNPLKASQPVGGSLATLGCVFHAIWPPIPWTFGHLIHADLATQSTPGGPLGRLRSAKSG